MRTLNIRLVVEDHVKDDLMIKAIGLAEEGYILGAVKLRNDGVGHLVPTEDFHFFTSDNRVPDITNKLMGFTQ
jgi:hypothetical protein